MDGRTVGLSAFQDYARNRPSYLVCDLFSQTELARLAGYQSRRINVERHSNPFDPLDGQRAVAVLQLLDCLPWNLGREHPAQLGAGQPAFLPEGDYVLADAHGKHAMAMRRIARLR